MKVVAGILGGLVFAILAAILLAVALAASPKAPFAGLVGFFAFWVIGLAVALIAPSAGKAWRRLLVLCSIASFLLPLSGVIYTGAFISTHVDQAAQHAGAATAGAAIGGGLVSGFLGFVGFFLGVIFLVIGLLVGRDKQIVYVEVPRPMASDGQVEPRM